MIYDCKGKKNFTKILCQPIKNKYAKKERIEQNRKILDKI